MLVVMGTASFQIGQVAQKTGLSGIVKADVDYTVGQAVITFDPAKQNVESLSKFIASCGYQVKEIKVI
jgi:hypothetical protein